MDRLERMSNEDLLSLMNMKHKVESTQLQYENLLLRITVKYQLRDGDRIEDDGTLTREPVPVPMPAPTEPHDQNEHPDK